ncbi:uncharacterized protein DS421_19g639150 [Arachis hypogaea]|uniref:Uncharacterized protein n=1 Tax=Arachis hypogaea TaxID=3818 RepID=A0A6B9V3M6_ARAHY|nr:uncharacterized protein DS421_19g639150 [Arachis hypogaea]
MRLSAVRKKELTVMEGVEWRWSVLQLGKRLVKKIEDDGRGSEFFLASSRDEEQLVKVTVAVDAASSRKNSGSEELMVVWLIWSDYDGTLSSNFESSSTGAYKHYPTAKWVVMSQKKKNKHNQAYRIIGTKTAGQIRSHAEKFFTKGNGYLLILIIC